MAEIVLGIVFAILALVSLVVSTFAGLMTALYGPGRPESTVLIVMPLVIGVLLGGVSILLFTAG